MEGGTLAGEAELSHDLLPAPVITRPAEGEEVDPGEAVIEWEPVAGAVAYEIIVEGEETEFYVLMGANATRVTVPAEFMRIRRGVQGRGPRHRGERQQDHHGARVHDERLTVTPE